mgnify:CR=1 FL=1
MSLSLLIIVFLLKNIETTCPIGCDSCYEKEDEYNCKKCSSGFYSEENPTKNSHYKCLKYQTNYHKSRKEINCCDRYYLYNGTCLSFNTECLTCFGSADNCNSCLDGYYLSNKKCLKCDTNCKTCRGTDVYCLSCKAGYYLNNNKCEKCASVCSMCTSL